MAVMQIGDLAARAASEYRRYSEADLASVQFVRRCQLLGFSLKEMQQLAELHSIVGASRRSTSPKARRGV